MWKTAIEPINGEARGRLKMRGSGGGGGTLHVNGGGLGERGCVSLELSAIFYIQPYPFLYEASGFCSLGTCWQPGKKPGLKSKGAWGFISNDIFKTINSARSVHILSYIITLPVFKKLANIYRES